MSPRNRVVLIVFLILLAGINGYLLAWPLSQSFKEVNTQVAATTADVELSQQKITDLQEFNLLIKKYPTEVDLLTLAAPGDLDLPQFMVQVEAIAVKSSVSLVSIQPPAKDGKDVSIQVSGSYEGLSAFVVNLEKNLRPSKVSEIQIAGASESNLTSMTIKVTPLTLTKTPSKTETGTEGEAGAAETAPAEGASQPGAEQTGGTSGQ